VAARFTCSTAGPSNGKGGATDGENVGYLVKGGDTGVKQYEASYSYNLSPRTMLNVGYVKLSNDCKAPYTFNINSYPIAIGQLNAAPGSAGDFCSGKPGGLVMGFRAPVSKDVSKQDRSDWV